MAMASPSTPLLSDSIRELMASLEAHVAQSDLSSEEDSQSASLSSEKDSHIADLEAEVQALQDKLAALLAAGLDAHAAHSKTVSQKDAEISALRASLAAVEGWMDEMVREMQPIGVLLRSALQHLKAAEDRLNEAGIEIGRNGHRPGSADKDEEKAEKLKAEYTKKMDAYNNPQAGGPEASGDSDKSKSEINDEEVGSENDE